MAELPKIKYAKNPHQKWHIETQNTYSFEMIYKGSEFLIKEFPNSKEYYQETEEKIEKI